MELINYNEFAKLRLHQFEPSAERWEACEDDSADLEFMDSLWFDQDSVPSVEFLRHQDEPDRVGAICLNLNCEPPELATRILAAIRLPLRRGMSLEELTKLLGPSHESVGGYDFMCGVTDPYLVRCGLHPDGRLNIVEIIRKDLLPEGLWKTV